MHLEVPHHVGLPVEGYQSLWRLSTVLSLLPVTACLMSSCRLLLWG